MRGAREWKPGRERESGSGNCRAVSSGRQGEVEGCWRCPFRIPRPKGPERVFNTIIFQKGLEKMSILIKVMLVL